MIRSGFLTSSVCERARAAAAVALLFLGGGLACAAEDEVPKFRFDPPDGTMYVEVANTTKVVDMGNLGTAIQESELRTRIAIDRTETGYRVTSALISARDKSDPDPEAGTGRHVLEGIELTLEVDGNAQLTDVAGLDEAVDKYKQTLSADQLAALSGVLETESMLSAVRTNWNHRFGHLASRRASIGAAWMVTEEFPLLAGGRAAAYVAVKVAERTQVAGRECLRVDYRYAADPEALREFLGDAAVELIDKQQLTSTSSGVSGHGHQLVDPTTLLCYGERTEVTMEMTIPLPERDAIPATLQWTKEYTFDHQPSE
jgi:hypothetical protein